MSSDMIELPASSSDQLTSSRSTAEAVSTSASPTITQTRHRRSASDIKPTSSAARKMSMNSTPQTRSGALPEPEGFVMQQIRKALRRPLVLMSCVMVVLVTTCTMFAVIYDLALDTSSIAIPPLRTGYFAQKSNPFNQYGVKLAWLHTSLIVIPHALTASPAYSSGPSRAKRLWAYIVSTICWVVFTTWFFGHGLGDRIIQLSGGQCVVAIPASWGLERKGLESYLTDLPKKVGAGAQLLPPISLPDASTLNTAPSADANEPLYLSVPSSLCTVRRPLNPTANPDLFSLFSSLPFPSSMYANQARPTLSIPTPRWYRGHDISGHVFILVLAILLLTRELYSTTRRAAQVRPVVSENHLRSDGARSPAPRTALAKDLPPIRTTPLSGNSGDDAGDTRTATLKWAHAVLTVFGWALVLLWLFMLAMTSIYFHNPAEKMSGLALGLFAGLLVDILSLNSAPPLPVPSDASAVISSPIATSPAALGAPLGPVGAQGRTGPGASAWSGGEGGGMSDETRARRGSIVDDGKIIDLGDKAKIE